MSKAMKGIGIIKKLNNMLHRYSLITIYKAFVRPHLDYGDLLYDQPNNQSLCQKIESIQYNAALAIPGAIRGTFQMKLYNELGFESLKCRRWSRKLCLFNKFKRTGLREYLFNIIPQSNHQCNTQSTEDATNSNCTTDTFKYFYFPSLILKWNDLDIKIRKANSLLSFKKSLLRVGRPTAMPTYGIHNPVGLKFLTRLRLGLSHLNEHKFKHNCKDCVNPSCSCSLEIESSSHFCLHCHYFTNIRSTPLNNLKSIDVNILKLSTQ